MVSVESGPYDSWPAANAQRLYELRQGRREMERKKQGTVESVTRPYKREGKWYITSVYRFSKPAQPDYEQPIASPIPVFGGLSFDVELPDLFDRGKPVSKKPVSFMDYLLGKNHAQREELTGW